MPSSPNYKRNYKQEKKTSDARGEKPKRAARNRARRKLMKEGVVSKGDGKDVDHKDGNTKNNKKSNLKAVSASKNRSYPRTKSGAKRSVSVARKK